MARASSRLVVRLVSYNILTPPYALSHVCDPAFLAEDYRLRLLQEKLEAEMAQRSIICLQEVGLEWSGKLAAYFSASCYAFMSTSYGNPGSQVRAQERDPGYLRPGIPSHFTQCIPYPTRAVHGRSSSMAEGLLLRDCIACGTRRRRQTATAGTRDLERVAKWGHQWDTCDTAPLHLGRYSSSQRHQQQQQQQHRSAAPRQCTPRACAGPGHVRRRDHWGREGGRAVDGSGPVC